MAYFFTPSFKIQVELKMLNPHILFQIASFKFRKELSWGKMTSDFAEKVFSTAIKATMIAQA
jgi:hypothetical protein